MFHRRGSRIYTSAWPSGQAESGKSTILKNFRLRFDPKALESEVRLNPLLKTLFQRLSQAKSGDHQQSYMLPVKK